MERLGIMYCEHKQRDLSETLKKHFVNQREWDPLKMYNVRPPAAQTTQQLFHIKWVLASFEIGEDFCLGQPACDSVEVFPAFVGRALSP